MKENTTEDTNMMDDDSKYFSLLGSMGYKIFVPQIDSFEERVLGELRSIMKELLGQKILNTNIKAKIYLIDNANINGSVCKCGSTYYISLFRGVIGGLKDFVSSFILDRLPYEFFNEKFSKIYEIKHNVFYFFKEGECEHYQLANYITNNILLLVLYHELGHILCGHQETMSMEGSVFMEANQNKKASILSQSKEFMADFFSMISTLSVYDSTYHDSLEEYTFNHCCYLIALYSLYIYFEGYQIQKDDSIGTYEELFERSHPHPAVRLQYMMDFMQIQTVYELRDVLKPKWFNKDEEKKILGEIEIKSYIAMLKFSSNLPDEFQLVNRSFGVSGMRLRRVIQNIASDLYEETYREVAIIELQEIARYPDEYVDEFIQGNCDVELYHDILDEIFHYKLLV